MRSFFTGVDRDRDRERDRDNATVQPSSTVRVLRDPLPGQPHNLYQQEYLNVIRLGARRAVLSTPRSLTRNMLIRAALSRLPPIKETNDDSLIPPSRYGYSTILETSELPGGVTVYWEWDESCCAYGHHIALNPNWKTNGKGKKYLEMCLARSTSGLTPALENEIIEQTLAREDFDHPYSANLILQLVMTEMLPSRREIDEDVRAQTADAHYQALPNYQLSL